MGSVYSLSGVVGRNWEVWGSVSDVVVPLRSPSIVCSLRALVVKRPIPPPLRVDLPSLVWNRWAVRCAVICALNLVGGGVGCWCCSAWCAMVRVAVERVSVDMGVW